MRVLWVAAAAVTVVFAFAAAPASAGQCCRAGAIFGVPQGPPSPYYLADQANPYYVVNEGPVYSGPGIFVANHIYYPSLPRPIYGIGGYAFVQAYYPPAMQVPYVRTFANWRCYGGATACGPYGAARPYAYPQARFAPYGTQLYRGEHGNRVIAPSSGY